jgi:hypothetical protein
VNGSNQGAASPAKHFLGTRRSANKTISASLLASAPAWAIDWTNGTARSLSAMCRIRSSQHFSLLTARIVGVHTSDGPTLELLTELAYRSLFEYLQNEIHHHPVRVWNFVPGILNPGGENLDRYMRFNAGRHRAYVAAFGGKETFDQSLPAASAVGHRGSDLVVHMLTSQSPGTPIANPRQQSPHRYSRRFGPLPPCFARATLVTPHESQKFLLIGGTASIRGEESVHVDDLNSQLRETCDNLIALLAAATGMPPSPALLNLLDQLRIYYPRSGDQPIIQPSIERWFMHPTKIEWRQADLCRADLMVEIEGRAILPS